MSSFEQTKLELEREFYATFPGARDAAAHLAPHPLQYDSRNELDISSTLVSFSDPTEELPCSSTSDYHTGEPLHWFYADYFYKTNLRPIEDKSLIEMLSTMKQSSQPLVFLL
jgi:hypothetical protein